MASERRSVVLQKGEDGWWTVECPSLPGCVSQGRTKEEALANIREAVRLYLDVLREDDQPVPCHDVELAAVDV